MHVVMGVPLLFACTARHELHDDRSGFAAGRRTAYQIELQELSREETGLVMRNLLGAASLPQRLERRILGLTEGNPLFVEQMLSMLIDDGLLREQAGRWVFSGGAEPVSIPGNVSSLLGARLDRLEPAERRVAESASVIGLEFSSDAVSALLEESDGRTDLEPAPASSHDEADRLGSLRDLLHVRTVVDALIRNLPAAGHEDGTEPAEEGAHAADPELVGEPRAPGASVGGVARRGPRNRAEDLGAPDGQDGGIGGATR